MICGFFRLWCLRHWGVKFESILLNFFHPILLSESEFSEFENFQNKYLIIVGFIRLILKF